MELRILFLTAFVLTLAGLTDNASLTSHEQKKYKQFLEGQGLYSPDDDVVILTVHNFKSQVMGSPQAWVVEFYNSWCGFCQRFAPSWKALATDLKGWRDLVKIAALDCSVDENASICREYEIMAYPTLRYFHEQYQVGPQNLGLGVQKGEDEAQHRHFLVQTLIIEQRKGRGSQYPNLIPYGHSNLDHLFDGVPNEVQYAFLVMERAGTYLGATVALDLHKTKGITVRYNNDTSLMSKLGISVIPTIIIVDRDNNHQMISSVESREEILNSVRKFLQNKQIRVTDDAPRQEIFTGKWLEVQVPEMGALMQERARKALKERIKLMGDVVFQMDLETALRYSLKHEVATIKTISGEKLRVLRSFIEILRKYFPFGHSGQVFLAELALKANEDQVEGSTLSEIIKRAEEAQNDDKVFSTPQQWLACRGSSPSFRGYPCGLWKLFHYLTVNSALRNIDNKHANPLEILDVMHGYVKNFFGCQDCSQHFQDMAARREMRNVSSLDSSVVWLWMAHNEVNKRLSGDQTEDPEYPKVQFPTKDRCPTCRNSDNSWNLSEVLRYMKNVYNALNVRYIGVDSTVLHSGLEGSQKVVNGSDGIFKSLDMSMCLILYVCSFLLLALLIRMFLKRGYRKKPYVHDLLGKV